MIAHIEGKLVVKSPTYLVVDCSGVGYGINISLNTFEKIKNEEHIRILTHLAVKEDSHTLYGFADEEEKQLFLQLISVNGVGTNTARMILSSLKPNEIKSAITNGNWALLKTIKGIGPKTAQRIVIDLQDKIIKTERKHIIYLAGGMQASPDGGIKWRRNIKSLLNQKGYYCIDPTKEENCLKPKIKLA